MEKDEELLQEARKVMIMKYPRFAQQIAKANLEYNTNLPFHTAATDGKNIYFDPDYFASLNSSDKLFLIAHELLHMKFQHMYRMTDKNGKMKNQNIWNIATDAIINANLERDGFKIKEGYVNIPNALNYTSEELYEKLLKEDDSLNEQSDDHSLWKDAFDGKQKTSNNRNSNEKINDDATPTQNFNEKEEFEKNREEKRKLAWEKLEKIKNAEFHKSTSIDRIEKVEPVANWKFILKREIDKTETIWSQRRSVAENNFAYRLEEIETDEAFTEVMLDTSISVSNFLLRNFLTQLIDLLGNSKLKVACFDDDFYGFSEIKSKKDIENYKIVGRGGTDFDNAVQNFTFNKKVNKIVFTDGYDKMTLTDNKYADIIWIVYENKEFNPACGKVIFVDVKNFEQNQNLDFELTN